MESLYNCKQCGKEHTRLNHLQRHEQSHSRRKVHVCRICSKTLIKIEHLKRHLVTHLREKPFSCKTCDRSFNLIEHLRNHIPRCKGDTVYTCDICNKVFYREDNLKVHRKLHDNQQPKLPTFENLDNIEDHYYQIDRDSNTTFSDQSDVEDCFEPKLEVTESADEEEVMEVTEFTRAEESNVNKAALVRGGNHDNSENKDNDNNEEDRASERLRSEEMEEKEEVKEEKLLVNLKDEWDIFRDDNEGDIAYRCDICNRVFNREVSLEVHKKMHDNQQSKFSRIENLDSIEDHYCHTNQDVNPTFLHYTNVDGYVKPKVEVTEGIDEEKKEVVEFTHHYEEKSVNEDASIGSEDHDNNECKENDRSEEKGADESLEIEKVVIKEEVKVEEMLVNFEDEYGENSEVTNEDSADGTVPGYLPEKSISPKLKSGRGRPRKNPNSPPKVKVPGRGRGRPPTKVKKGEKDEEYKCKECNKEFNRTSHLKRHLVSHSAVKPFGCTVCTKSFNRRDHLNQHQKLHERQNDYKCDICEKPFDASDLLAKHKVSQHGIGEKIMDEKKYECPHCHKAFATEKYRDLHVTGHNGQKENMCDVCKRTFLSKPYLTEHMKVHNEHSKKFLCSECGQRFTRKDYLVIHMRRHRGEKPFECKYCGKAFSRTTDLTAHERCHTGEKSHYCTICGKGFGRAHHLTVHMRTHTGEKPYQCTYCDAAFAQGNDLRAHVRRHTGERLQCKLCTESFPLRHLLTQHKRTVHSVSL